MEGNVWVYLEYVILSEFTGCQKKSPFPSEAESSPMICLWKQHTRWDSRKWARKNKKGKIPGVEEELKANNEHQL